MALVSEAREALELHETLIYERSEAPALVFEKMMKRMCVYAELHEYVVWQQSQSNSASNNASSQSLCGRRSCSCACCSIVTIS
jgi:hypothetical protein